jgi:hypothetical protein
MNTEESKYASNNKYVTINRGKDCWYIIDNNGITIASRIAKKSAEDWLRQRGYKLSK